MNRQPRYSGRGADFNDVSNFFGIFTTNDGNNNGKWSNKEFDDLLIQGVKELDSAKRLEIYKKAEQIMCADDPAIIMGYYGDLQTFRYKYVKGFMIPLFGGYYSLKYVYIQGRS
jgi:oligopeptide transport system substrate-binding protein